MKSRILTCCILLFSSLVVKGQIQKNDRHILRAQELVGQLTISEKVSQLLNASPAIERFAIPEYNWWNECLHGVARASIATVFPQPIGLGATFDKGLIQSIGDVASTEARIIHHQAVRHGYRGIYYGLTVWSPNINLFRDPRWGRGHETYGEDPFLMGELGKAYILGLQGPDANDLKVIATPKHFAVHSGPENKRHGFDARVSLKDLNESYLPHFRKAIIEGSAGSVMCAYNSINGKPACANDSLVNRILRKKWGFNGYIVSDCGAVEDIYQGHKLARNEQEAARQALNAGLDLECMVGVVPAFRTIAMQVESKFIDESKLNKAVERLFTARSKLGLLQKNDRSKWQDLSHKLVNHTKHKSLALKAALESAVLLKNTGRILPLKRGIKVSVIGPHINSKEALWGNYHGIPDTTITIADGLIATLNDRLIGAEPGCQLIEGFPEFETISSRFLSYNGKKGAFAVRYYNSDTVANDIALDEVKPDVDFSFSADRPSKSKVSAITYTADWSGQLVAPETGEYEIGALTEGSFKLYINNRLHVHEWPRQKSGLPVMKPIKLEKGQTISIRFVYTRQEYSYAKLIWRKPGPKPEDYLSRALKIASQSDVIVTALGLSPNLEGEEMGLVLPGFEAGDRTNLNLPLSQQSLLRALSKLGKPIISILVHGGPISDPVLDSVASAILSVWYPGQMGGSAVAQLLSGQVSPAGRLPVSIVNDVNDLPAFENYAMAGRTYRFMKTKPRYAFGYGLSYGQFSYQVATCHSYGTDSLELRFKVENNSRYNSDEVTQVYAHYPALGKNETALKLVGFKRYHLGSGQSADHIIRIAKRDLHSVNGAGEIVKPDSPPKLFIGGGQPFYLPATSSGLWLKTIKW